MLQERYGKLEGSCWTDREILVMYPTCGRDIQAHKPGRTLSGTDVTAECSGQGSCSTAPDKIPEFSQLWLGDPKSFQELSFQLFNPSMQWDARSELLQKLWLSLNLRSIHHQVCNTEHTQTPVHTNTSTTHNKLKMVAVLCQFLQSINYYTNQPNANSIMPRSAMLCFTFKDSKEQDNKKSQLCQIKFCMQYGMDCSFGYTEIVTWHANYDDNNGNIITRVHTLKLNGQQYCDNSQDTRKKRMLSMCHEGSNYCKYEEYHAVVSK